MCAKKVRSSLLKLDTLTDLTLQMEPSRAHFAIDAQKESIQDMILAVRAAGSEYDARLMLQSNADDDKLSEALRKVDGVRSAGMADKNGVRLLTFFFDKKTYLKDLDDAAKSIGAQIAPAPVAK